MLPMKMKFTGFQRGFQKYNFFGQGSPNFRGRTDGKFRKNGQNQRNLLLCKFGSGLF